MRTHGLFADIRPAYDRQRQRRLVRAEHVVAARVETSWSNKYEGLLDIVFSDGDAFSVVSYLVIDGVMLIEPEAEILLWPTWMNWLDLDEVDRIEAVLSPWLRSLTIARFENGEHLRIFSEDVHTRALIERARTRGWLGAAPSEQVLTQLSPYVYAQRFAFGRSVAIADAQGANGAALLSRTAGRLRADLGDDALMRDAAKWFDLDVFQSFEADTRYDVAVGARSVSIEADTRIWLDGEPLADERVVDVAAPLPMGVMVSFDIDDAPVSRSFAVAAKPISPRHVSLPEARPIGGSGGRIALVVRDDAERMPDAEIDAANTLERRLRAEGFNAELVSAPRLNVGAFDLIHVFGWRLGAKIRSQLDVAKASGKPVAVTPYVDDRTNESEWGERITLSSLRNSNDREMIDEYFEAIGLRRLVAHEIDRPKGTEIDADTAHLLQTAGVAFVTCAEEEAHLRSVCGYKGAAVEVSGLADWVKPEDVVTLVGPDEFVLAHGPVESRSGLYTLARVAERLDLPLVIVGHVRDVEYYQHTIGAFGPRAKWLPQNLLTSGEIAGLYARARVFADISWSGSGLHRLARAAWAGASLVGSAAGYGPSVWGDALVSADPGSLPNVEAALKQAWNEAPARARRAHQVATIRFDPMGTLVATVKGYQQALASK